MKKIIFFGIVFFLSLFQLNAFTPEQNQILDLECNLKNYTFSQCQTYRSLYDISVSNETNLILNTKSSLETLLNNNVQNLQTQIKNNFTILNNKDYAQFNDSLQIKLLNQNLTYYLRNLNSRLLLLENLSSVSGTTNDRELTYVEKMEAARKIKSQLEEEAFDRQLILQTIGGDPLADLSSSNITANTYSKEELNDLFVQARNYADGLVSIDTSIFLTKSQGLLILIGFIVLGFSTFWLYNQMKDLKSNLEHSTPKFDFESISKSIQSQNDEISKRSENKGGF